MGLEKVTLITACDIHAILLSWMSGEISETDVKSWAEERFFTSQFEVESEAANEVLGRLDRLDIDLTTKEDAAKLIEALRASNFRELLTSLDSSVDIQRRKVQLKEYPFYSRFCI